MRFSKNYTIPLEYFLPNVNDFPALFEVWGWGETVVKAFWIGMIWHSKYRFLDCHFINGSFWKYLIKNFWKWRLVSTILKAALLGCFCFNCLFLVSISFSFFSNFGKLVILSFFASTSWSCFYMVLHVFRTYLTGALNKFGHIYV